MLKLLAVFCRWPQLPLSLAGPVLISPGYAAAGLSAGKVYSVLKLTLGKLTSAHCCEQPPACGQPTGMRTQRRVDLDFALPWWYAACLRV